ncbi:MAG: trypsin-like serine protease [Oligoflexales bacterium]
MRNLILLSFFITSNLYAIFNGQSLEDSDLLSKSLVALQVANPEKAGIVYYKSSGVVLGKRAILSAAHTFYYRNPAAEVWAIFSTNPSWGPDKGTEERIKVARIELHPDFYMTATGTENDVAVLFLEEDIPDTYRPLRLAKQSDIAPAQGSHLMIAGYGRSQENPGPSDFRLRVAVRPIVSSPETKEPVPGSKLWVDQRSGGFCGGDSGGPALLQSAQELIIYGIAIHPGRDENNELSCLTKGAYTRVQFYEDWLDSVGTSR